MQNPFVIVPPIGGEGFVALSHSAKGHVFEKHILSFGDLYYPSVKGGKVNIDQTFADALVRNFDNGVAGIVQVPKADKNNEHTDDPDRNVGEVIGLSARDGKIYAEIDARDETAAEKIRKGLILGASAYMHLDYKDTRSNQRVGPTLLHVCLTNRPYVVDLDDFSELVAATADGSSEAVILSAPKENSTMTKDELLAALRDEHGINVEELQTRAAAADTALSLTNAVRDELTEAGFISLTAGQEPSTEDLVSAITGAKDQIVSLTSTVNEIREASAKKDATARVKALIKDGRILPKNEAAQITLLLTNAELFEELLPEKSLVRLSNSEDSGERGTEPIDPSHDETVSSEIMRLTQSDAAKQYIHN